MMIEKSNTTDFVFIFALAILTALTGLAGSLAPGTTIQLSSSRLLHNDIWKSPLFVEINDLSPFNMYVYADLQFVTFTYHDKITEPVNLKINFNYYLKDQNVYQDQQEIQYIAEYPNYPSKVSKPIRIFMSQIIDFDRVTYTISYKNPPKEAKYLVTSHYRYEPNVAILFLILRSLFTLLTGILFLIFITSFRYPYDQWRIEQKTTITLLIVSMLNLNPFLFYMNLHNPSLFYLILIHGFDSAYFSFLFIYILIILETLTINPQIKDKKRVYVILFTIRFLVDFFHKINDQIYLYDYSSDVSSPYNLFFDLEVLLNIIYIGVFLLKTAVVLSHLNPSYNRKALIYSEIFFLNLILIIIKYEVCSIFLFLEQSALNIIMNFVIAGLVPLTFAYFHWPLRKLRNDDLSSSYSDISPVELYDPSKEFK